MLRWYILVPLFLLTFMAGAVTYRFQVHLPITTFIHQLTTSGLQGVDWPSSVDEAARSIKEEVQLYENNGLPTMYIDLEFEDYQKLLDKRNEALAIGVLNSSDEDYVPARIHVEDQPGKDVKLRLKEIGQIT